MFTLGIFTTGERADERAVPWLRESLTIWRAVGDAEGTAQALALLGIKLKKLGEYAEAAQLLDEAASLFEQVGSHATQALALHHRGMVAFGLGALAEAEATVANAIELHRRPGGSGSPLAWVAQALGDLGFVVAERGDLARAAELELESLALWRPTGAREGMADVFMALATIMAMAGQLEQAARLYGAAHGQADAAGYAFGCPELPITELLFESLEKSMGTEAYTAAWDAGRVMTLEQAATEALAIRMPTSAQPDAAQSPDLPAGLSPREVDVLRLLVAGASNREIAEQLFVSPRTVQTHLTNIFGKLGVATRASAIAYAYQHKLV